MDGVNKSQMDNRAWDKLLAQVRGSFDLFDNGLDPALASRFKIVKLQVEDAIYQARCTITDAPRSKRQ